MAQISKDFTISKKELGAVYKLMKGTKVEGDFDKFLEWCLSASDQETGKLIALDANEVGEFVSEKLESNEMEISNLSFTALNFWQSYFISINEKEKNLIKLAKTSPKTYYGNYGYGGNGYGYYNAQKKLKPEDEDCPNLKIMKAPHELSLVDLLWKITLYCEKKTVV